jgi:hypothetical protein
MPKNQQPKPPKANDYERIGRSMMHIYEGGYSNRKRMYQVTFFKGILTGLGSVIGATLVVALLLWALSLFDSLPLIDQLRDTIDTENSARL